MAVRLAEDVDALVFEVRDSANKPVAGVPVGLQMIRADAAETLAWNSRTANDGRVRLPHLEHALRRVAGESYLPYASILGPLGVDRVAIDPSNLPDGPVRLVLPAYGSLRVRLEFPAGSQPPDSFWVYAVELGAGRQAGDYVRGRTHSLIATPADGHAGPGAGPF